MQTLELPKSLSTKQAVIATLAYFDLFGIPLTRAEISEHLFFLEPDEQKIDIYLKESHLIRQHDGYFSLQGDEAFFLNFYKKKQRAKDYWKRVKRYQWLFSICPFVELVAVCNSLPLEDVNENSDIDLFIVVKKGKLFTARFFLTLLTQVFGVRRHGKKVKKRFCLSFYITDEHLNFEPLAQQPFDIYLAYWIKTIEPISGDLQIYENFLKANAEWLKTYFVSESRPRRRFFKKRTEKQETWKARLERWFGADEWEKRFQTNQWNRIQEKYQNLHEKSGTVLSENMLKFHDQDIRGEIKNRWMKRVDALL